MDWIDVENLAVAVLNLDEATADRDVIEQALFDNFEVSLEQFTLIAESLMPFTLPLKSAINGEVFNGFVKDGMFICKQSVRT